MLGICPSAGDVPLFVRSRMKFPSDTAERLFIALTGQKCDCCDQHFATPNHPCPWQEELNDFSGDWCNCCDKCVNECLMDI
jgi:flavoprotein